MKIKMKASSEPRWLPPESFFRDFVSRFHRLKSFFSHDPRSPGTIVQRPDQLAGQQAADRQLISSELVRQNTSWGGQPEGLAAARQLGQEDTMVVLCQLRPQVLGGTAGNLLKVLTTLEYARRLKKISGRQVVPVAWVIADHNWGEMRQVTAVSADDQLHRLQLNTEVDGCPSGDRIPIHPAAPQLLGELAETVRVAGEDNAAWCFFRQTAADSSTLTEWTCRILVNLFSRNGLVVLDASSHRLRRAAVPLLQQVVLRRDSLQKELRAKAGQMEKRGYGAPFSAEEPAALLFWDAERGRRRVVPEDGRSDVAAESKGLGNRDLSNVLEYDAGRFSPGEAVRPIVQDYLLPVAAHVVSADESALRAQVGEIYRLFGMYMPPIFPRVCATFVSRQVQCEMQRWDIDMSSLVCKEDGVLTIEAQQQRQIHRLQELSVDDVFEETKKTIAAAHEELAERLSCQIPSLQAVQEENRERIIEQLNYLRSKARHHHRRKFNELIGGFRKVKNRLRPGGNCQGTVAFAPLLMEVGLDWPKAVLTCLRKQEQLWGHWWIFEVDGEDD